MEEKIGRVVLIGETEGNPDEGMKNISQCLSTHLLKCFTIKVVRPSAIHSSIQAIRTFSPDIIHYLHGPSYKSIIALGLLRSVSRNSLSILSFTHPHFGTLEKQLLRVFTPDLCIVQSSKWKELTDSCGAPSHLVPLSGVDMTRFVPVDRKQKTELRQALQLPVSSKIILHVGHINDRRNLESLAAIQQMPKTQVIIIGSSTTQVNRALLYNLRQAGMIVRVGYTPCIQNYYQVADCYVFPTIDSQGAIEIPLSVLEAMATNLPVVSTKFGGLQDFFAPKEGLWFLDYPTPAILKTSVDLALRTSSIQTRHLVKDWSWAAITETLRIIYMDLLK